MLELVSRGKARDNKLHRKEIETIVERQCEQLYSDFAASHAKQIASSRGIWAPGGLNPLISSSFSAVALREAALQRSLETSVGKTFELIAREVGGLSYEVTDQVPTDALTEGQMKKVTALMAKLDHHWSADESYLKYRDEGDDRDPSDLEKIFEREFLKDSHHIVDGDFLDEKNVHHLIQVKASGKLNKGSARQEKLELISTLLGYTNYLRNHDIGWVQDHPIYPHLCTALDGDILAVSPGVRQYWASSELMLGDDFWKFVTHLDDGGTIVYGAMRRVGEDVGRDTISEIMHHAYPPTLRPPDDDTVELVDDEGFSL